MGKKDGGGGGENWGGSGGWGGGGGNWDGGGGGGGNKKNKKTGKDWSKEKKAAENKKTEAENRRLEKDKEFQSKKDKERKENVLDIRTKPIKNNVWTSKMPNFAPRHNILAKLRKCWLKVPLVSRFFVQELCLMLRTLIAYKI